MSQASILLFKGTSFVSRFIRWFTWSEYSHVAILFNSDGMVYESWDGVGVIKSFRWELGKSHTSGTQVDIYDFNQPLTDDEARQMREYAESQVGRKYDRMAILGFLLRKKLQSKDRLFCSEYVLDICRAAKRHILRQNDYQTPPCAFAQTLALSLSGGFKIEEC